MLFCVLYSRSPGQDKRKKVSILTLWLRVNPYIKFPLTSVVINALKLITIKLQEPNQIDVWVYLQAFPAHSNFFLFYKLEKLGIVMLGEFEQALIQWLTGADQLAERC